MMPLLFKCKDTFELYTKMALNFTKKIGKNKFEAILVKNSGHLEQMDRCITEEWLFASVSPSMSNVAAEKKEGSNVEFHEFLGCAWLEYLYRIGHHDNTFGPYNYNQRVN